MKFHLPILPTLIRYSHVFKPYVGYRIIICVALILLCSVLEGFGITLFYPLLIQTTNTIVDNNRFYQLICKSFGALNISMSVLAILTAIIILTCVKSMIKFFQEVYTTYLYSNVARGLRHRMINAYSNMDYRYYTGKNTGFLTNVITTEANTASGAFKFYIQIISGLIYINVFLVISLLLNWQFTLLAIFFGSTAVFSLKFLSTLSRKYSSEGTFENCIMQSLLIQTIQSFKYLVSTARFKVFQKKLNKTVDKLTHLGYRIAVVNAASRSIGEPFIILFLVGIIYYYVVMIKMNIASIVISVILFQRIMYMIMNLQVIWQSFHATIGGLDIVSLTMEELEQNRQPAGGEEFVGLKNMIEFRDVSFSYDGNSLFNRLNVRMEKNKMIALVGESGSGKSTLVDLLTGLLKPDAGSILVDGKDLGVIDKHFYRERIGYVTQESIIFDDTISNNISLWACDSGRAECMEKIKSAARRANCEEFILSMPDSYYSMIGDRGVNLSGGQRQRIAIARELFKEPDILILDEATSALDPESEESIQQSMNQLRGKMTVVVISHRFSTVRNCDYVYLLRSGTVVEEGTIDSLMQNDRSSFNMMYKIQQVV